MEALYLLVPMSVAVVFFTIWLFFNASDGGQFDDLVGPGMRILQDDDSGGISGNNRMAGLGSNDADDGQIGTSGNAARDGSVVPK